MRDDQTIPLDKLEGVIERLTFHNEESGYTVAKFLPKDKHQKVTIVGSMLGVNAGESLALMGLWTRHGAYGRQFEVKHYKLLLPATIQGIRTYLGSGLIKGLGPKTAESIVEHFHLETLNVIDKEPHRLQEVPGIGEKRVRIIVKAWAEQKHIKEVMIFLQNHFITPSLAIQVYKHYGDSSISILCNDPYRLAEDIFGIEFHVADDIAQKLGLPYDAPQRIRAGLLFACRYLNKEGHVFATRPQLIDVSARLLDVEPLKCETHLPALMRPVTEPQTDDEPTKEKALAELPPLLLELEKERIYLPAYYYAELGITSKLKELIHSPWDRLAFYRNANWPAVFAWLDKHQPFLLSPEQQEAVKMSLTTPVMVLTGGPGTGKSTVIGTIIKLLQAKDKTVLLAAPTGRAAKRLRETTGELAQTIHRLLEWSPSAEKNFIRNNEYPLDADMIVIDEASMIDTLLMHHLLQAVKGGTHLLLVGDVNQLPCVGAGDILRDLITSEVVPLVTLAQIYRQSKDSYIISNAHRINNGQLPIFLRDSHDFFLFKEDNPHQAAALLIDIVSRRLPQSFGLNAERDIQVLSPMYRGAVGVIALNEALQQILNPPSSEKVECPHNEIIMREGDRVMQVQNNYEKEVFNGDLGYIRQIEPDEQIVLINFDGQLIQYEFHELDQVTHSYATTVHKSQGSEYPVVVIPLLAEHYTMLQRNLFYTAITRAKQIVVLVGSKHAIKRAVENSQIEARNTSLAERLREANEWEWQAKAEEE